MRKNKKLWIIVIGAVIAFIVVAVTILTQGSRYTMRTGNMSEPIKMEVVTEPEGIVEVENVRMENGEMVIDFKALRQGRTNISYRYQYEGEEFINERGNYVLDVLPFNIIVENSHYITNFSGYMTVVIAFVCLMFLTTCVMLWSFIDYWRHGEFGYKMIICGGVGIYSGVLWLFIVYKLLNNWVKHFAHFMQEVSETGGFCSLYTGGFRDRRHRIPGADSGDVHPFLPSVIEQYPAHPQGGQAPCQCAGNHLRYSLGVGNGGAPRLQFRTFFLDVEQSNPLRHPFCADLYH